MEPNQPIAVVGMSGLFPGALDLDTFWHNIIHKIDTATEVPPERWIIEPEAIIDPAPQPDKAYSRRACLIQGFEFDPQGIDIDEDLLAALDPLYHLVLHAGREAFSKCEASSLNPARTGVILASIVLPTDNYTQVPAKLLI